MPRAVIDEIVTWAKTNITKEKTKWTLVHAVIKLAHSEHSYSICSFVSINKTEQNRNDEEINQTSSLLRIYTNQGVRETAILAHHGDLQSSQWWCHNSRRGIIVESRLGIATRLLSSLFPSFMSHYLAGFTWTFHFQILYLDLQTTSKKLKSSCRIIWVNLNHCRLWMV